MKTKSRICLLVALGTISLGLLLSPGRTDSWGPPHPSIFASDDGCYAVTVVPPKSGGSDGRAMAFLFRPGSNGASIPVWKWKLVNLPQQVLISGNRAAAVSVVTLDTYARLGFEHALVVYGPQGKLLADYRLEDLLTPQELARVPASVSSRFWTEERVFRFTDYGRVPHLVIRRASDTNQTGRAIRINLQTGKLRSAKP